MRLSLHGLLPLVGLLALGVGCASGEEATSADMGSDLDGGNACRAPRIVCDGVCIDPATDLDHCGRCDFACRPGGFCAGGACDDDCLDSETLCEAECVFLDTDRRHCGFCGRACASDQQCLGGECRCPDRETLCGADCVDLDTDKAHCGRCDTACKVDEACVARACLSDCTNPAILCGGVCVDVRNNDNFCGDCDTQCGAGEVCSNSDCECAADRTPCGDACVDTNTSAEHCGGCDDPCLAGAVCRDGDCACPPGRDLCDAQCVDTDSNPAYCGNCVTDCGDGLCVDGGCVSECPSEEVVCDDQCVDTDVDPSYCGNCETACRADQDCAGGFCVCPDGFTECDDRCVDTDASSAYCGNCVTSCAGDEACVGGTCGCVEGLTECGGACVDTDTSGRHCGRCDLQCAPLEFCREGGCACIAGLDRCGDDCVQVGVDAAHCLGCNQPCDEGEVCDEGACELECTGGLLACGGACIEPATNLQHCGGCDRPCTGWESCVDSACACVNDFWEFEFPPPDDSLAQAIPLPIGSLGDSPHVRNLRLCGEDVDWYSIYLPSGGASLEVYLDADCLDAVLPRISLWNTDGTAQIDVDEADGTGPCPTLIVDALDAGWVNLKVESTAGEGPYDVFVFPGDLSEVEPNEDPDTATGPFDADADVAGEISAGDDFDTFAVYNARPATVTLETSGGGTSCAVDTVLFVTDALGVAVGDDDDGGAGLCSRLDLDLPTGLFFVTVFGYDAEEIGPYQLAVRYDWHTEQEPNDASVFEGPFSATFGAEGVIFPAFEQDDYRIALAAPASIRATVSSTGFGCYIDSILALADEGVGLELGGDDDYDADATRANRRGTGYCSVIDPTVDTPDHSFAADLAPGEYTLSVTAFSDRTGPYVLTVEVLE